MDIARVSLPEYVDSSLFLAFPGLDHRGTSGKAEPQALLSLRAAGDMRYFHRGINSRREKFFGRRGIEASRVLGIKLAHSRSILFPSDRAEQERLVDEAIGDRAAFSDGGRWRIDLREANIVLAERSGIGAFLSVDACTSCDPRLGSYRREGPEHFTCMAAACGVFEEPTVGSL